ncbi:XRN 5'-3' exonuclease N-terminus-domain-containing protein [Polychytrium aggregatum]|uniref:XRN 5'-3' exonuclease N-terminus-domain-containing protein n=1 Tax=Polychytrium aggregatum TaxID=110093 RepID=UPI0022FE1D7D|nr:XRN 5'-3' exonuclease N-terminus-domain-containing protein [Polychytrium aggregatum]KAI9209938.1 XRN 5'-3' exonuclease N-terminus-domain-containing protein [Polychytrium aggregatum]
MGVAGFYKWLKTLSEGSFSRPTRPRAFDHIYVDGNFYLYRSSLHASLGVTGDWNRAKSNAVSGLAFQYINRSMGLFRPRRSLFVALDGSAGWAKILTQRARRQHRGALAELTNIPSNHFTPGTNFMIRLEDHLIYHSCRFLLSHSLPEVTVSSSCVPGEGEGKIVASIARRQRRSKSSDSFLIMSGDSDVVLQVIAAKLANTLVYSTVSKELCDPSTFVNTIPTRFPACNPDRITRDFCLIALLSGNDYLPKLRYLPPPKVWERYCEYREENQDQPCQDYLVSEDLTSINLSLLYRLASGKSFKHASRRSPGPRLKKVHTSAPVAEDGSAASEMGSPIQTKDILRVYLNALIWNLRIYVLGDDRASRFVYPQQISPDHRLIEWGLEEFLKALESGDESMEGFFSLQPQSEPMPTALCAVALLPHKDKKLLPQPLHSLFEQFHKRADARPTPLSLIQDLEWLESEGIKQLEKYPELAIVAAPGDPTTITLDWNRPAITGLQRDMPDGYEWKRQVEENGFRFFRETYEPPPEGCFSFDQAVKREAITWRELGCASARLYESDLEASPSRHSADLVLQLTPDDSNPFAGLQTLVLKE